MTNQLPDVSTLLEILGTQLQQTITDRKLVNPLMIGIRTGGVWVAEMLHQQLMLSEPLGILDISFYRDDFSQLGVNPNVKPSHIPSQIEDRNIILVDDVFYSGRTIRAALNEIFDYGRPKQVVLAVLIDRDSKQIPISPDCCGAKIMLPARQRIKLTGPKPLALILQNLGSTALTHYD